MNSSIQPTLPTPGKKTGLLESWWLLGLVALVSLVILLWLFPAAALLDALVRWIGKLGPYAAVVFVLAYLLATIFMLPASPMSIAAGALFGLLFGTMLVLTGAILGMGVTFLIARYAARDWVLKRIQFSPRLYAFDQAIAEGGWRVVVLLRLSPLFPFNLQNYFYGITGIGFWPCILASAAAIVPGTLAFVYLGYAGRVTLQGAAAENAAWGAGQWILLAIGLAATLGVTFYVSRLAQRKLRDQMRHSDASREAMRGTHG